MPERTVYTFVGHPLYKPRLVRRDTSWEDRPPQAPYALIVARRGEIEFTVAELSRAELLELHVAIDRELLGR